ncbi:MAG: sensor histidine kinase [Woeseiaceae bacterium]
MDIRKLSNTLAVLAAILVVAVLSLLIIESRSVKDEHYASQAERTRLIETTRTDLTALLDGMTSAIESGGRITPATELVNARLRENAQALHEFRDVVPQNVDEISPLKDFDNALTLFLISSQTLMSTQNTLAEALLRFQEESPEFVRNLRELGRSTQSGAVFTLAIDVIDFSTGQRTSDPVRLRNRIEELRNDATFAAQAPDMAAGFLATAETVVEQHVAAELTLDAIRRNPVNAKLSALEAAEAAVNRVAMQRAETAQILLAVCAVLLLLGAAFSIYKLQSSYRQLNQSNENLQRSNDTLEERVGERTEELEKAYDDLKESQVQLIHAEKMSSLGEMIAGISHEINTPLWYLTSNSSVIQELLDSVGELSDVAESMVEAALSGPENNKSLRQGLVDMHRMMKSGIKEEIDEAKGLMQDSIEGLEELSTLAQGLKDFSRLDRAEHAAFDVNEGLDKALLIINNRLKGRISVHKYYGPVPTIYCSPSQINQVFLNILTNAADAIDGLGDIVLQTREENGNVLISIGDTGAGIPADVLPRIRDPFFTTKEIGKGTGLGMSIVDQIVAAHKGKLHIESKQGKGTTITIEIPVVDHGTVVIEHDQEAEIPDIVKLIPAVNQSNGQLTQEFGAPPAV